jgi:hypothetical protein
VISVGAERFGDGWDGADLFEGPEIIWPNLRIHETAFARSAYYSDLNDPYIAKAYLHGLLDDFAHADRVSRDQRQRAIDLFGIDKIGPMWREFLG